MRVPIGEGAFWLTVSPPNQEGLEITLMSVMSGPMFQGETRENLANLIRKGTFGFGVFECKAKGVLFTKPPTEEFYGIEAMFKDDSPRGKPTRY